MKTIANISAFTVIAALFVSSCAGPKPIAPEIAWPDKPLPTKVRYLSSFHGSQDLSRGFFGGVKDFLFGKQAQMNVNKPYGVAFDGVAKLYLAETANKGVQIFDIKDGSSTFLKKIAPRKTLLEPVYVILDKSGQIYVSDTEIRRVVVFNSDNSFSHFIGDRGQFDAPVGMAIDETRNRLYVVDTRQHNVKVFNLNGELINTIGKRGDNRGEFHYPTTVAVSPDGKVYIVDSFHFAVQIFDTNGVYLNSFGPTEAGPGMMARPRDIAIDRDGNLYITDATRNNVQVYNEAGQLMLAFGQTGVEAGEFQLPAGICITKDKRIYVADSINRRVQIFEYFCESANEGSDNE